MNIKNRNKVSSWMMLGFFMTFFAFQMSASAEVITGKIVDVNSDDNVVTVSKMAPTHEIGKETKVHLSDKTQLNGIQSLNDLQVGDEVTLETNRKYFIGPWQAKHITRSGNADMQGEHNIFSEARSLGEAQVDQENDAFDQTGDDLSETSIKTAQQEFGNEPIVEESMAGADSMLDHDDEDSEVVASGRPFISSSQTPSKEILYGENRARTE